MKKLSLLLVTFGCFSCRTIYYPNVANVPLFQEKNEIQISGNLSNAQIAYSPTNHVGIMANYFNKKNHYHEHSTGNGGNQKGNYLEGGIGYFKTIGKHSDDFNKTVFEVYAGGGKGSVYQENNVGISPLSSFIPLPQIFRSSATKLFLQPTIGYGNYWVMIAFTPKLIYLKYDDIVRENMLPSSDARNYGYYPIDNKNFVFIEPTVTLRGGFRNVKLQLQGIYSNPPYLNSGSYLQFNAALHIHFAKRLKKNAQS